MRLPPKVKNRPIAVKPKPRSVMQERIVIKPKPAPVRPKEVVDRHRTRMREKLRKENGTVLTSCVDNVSNLESFAKTYVVELPSGKVCEIKGFNITSLGEPLGTTGVTVTRWVNSGMLPAPFLSTSRGAVYSIEEVRSFVEIIGELQKDSKQYRKSHTDTKERIFVANARIRKGFA